MAIQHPASGTIVNTTFTGGTKLQIVNALNTHLKTAGWTAISGDGTNDVILESATTPTASNSIRVRLRETGLTNCALINMQNTAATKVSQSLFLLPSTSRTYRIVANKYQFFCWAPGTAAREWIMLGTLFIPSWLHGVITGDLGFAACNSSGDASATVSATFQTANNMGDANNHTWSAILNGGLTDAGNNSWTASAPRWVVQTHTAPARTNLSGYRWHDGTLTISDPLLAFGVLLNSDPALIRGQLWGCMWVSDYYAPDTVWTGVNGHDWISIGGNAGVDGSDAKGTLFMATT